MRLIVEAVQRPISPSFAGPGPRLAHEIGFAGGVTGNSGNAFFFPLIITICHFFRLSIIDNI